LLFVSGYTYAGAAEGENESKKTAESAQLPRPYFNTAHFLDDKAQLLASYDKQVLVPFFEYIPYEATFPFLRALFPGTYQYVPGSTSKTISFNKHVNLVPLICYETVFPDLVYPFVESGGNIMINLTNDIWLGETDGSKYHFAMGMFRAVEHGVPWVRATNSGVSGVVSATGVIDPETLTPVMSQASKVATVMVPQRRTFYSHTGDIFLYLLCVVFLIGLALPSREGRLSG
jgi:apolipoprotein N-acyltransferase